MSYQFFSEADVDPQTGKVKSMYPMWYYPQLIQELEDEVISRRSALESKQVNPGQEMEYRENLLRMEKQLEKVQNMTMVDDAKNDRGTLGKAIKDLAKIIKQELPTRDFCDRNLVDPSQEYSKMTKPYIKVLDDNMAEIAKACNVPIVDGKITREGAAVMWKIASKYMGEYANTESLRRM